jgi:hypothetical protein
MLSDADNLPSVPFELPANSAVPKSVGRNHIVPELSIFLWTLTAFRTTVPEAAIDKKNEALASNLTSVEALPMLVICAMTKDLFAFEKMSATASEK